MDLSRREFGALVLGGLQQVSGIGIGVSPVFASSMGSKTYVSGSNGYRADGAVKLMSAYHANCTALAIRRRHKLPACTHVKGVGFANTLGGTVNGMTLGEGAGVSACKHYAVLTIAGVDYPLYTASGSRELSLAANAVGEMYLAQLVKVSQGDVIWLKFTYECASPSDTVHRFQPILYTEKEERINYTNASASVNQASARAQVDNASWDPTAAAQSTLTTLTHEPSFAYILLQGDSDTLVVGGFGTSRECGAPNPYLATPLVNDGYWQRACEALGVPYINFAKGSARGYQDLANISIRSQCMTGVNLVLNGHPQNDFPHQTLTQVQSTMKTFKETMAGRRIVTVTQDPWVQALTSANNALDDYVNGYPFPLADATSNTERRAWNEYNRGNSVLLTGGDGLSVLDQMSMYEVDTAAQVTALGDLDQWKASAQVLAGTSTATSSTSLTDSVGLAALPEFVLYDYFITTLTAADAVTWAYIRGNRTGGVVVIDRSSAGASAWSNGTPGVGKAYSIHLVYHPDGIHASDAGRIVKASSFTTLLQSLL